MSKYIYEPDTLYWKDSDISDLFKEDNFGEYLKIFFDLPDIKEYVTSNNWEMIFERWEFGDRFKYNPKQWTAEPLAFFLHHFAHIDFMKYLDDPTKYGFYEGCLKEVDD